ncbi:peptidoglycan DD-metalloendopeptidase family protein [Candidatus Poribacteria bacterium]|nr:peptidoglycan DD-metalloendopeptidase family protein [Candidatus Poribacteria bacterium]
MESYRLAIKEGLRNSWRERTLSLAMTGCVAVSVFAVGVFGLLKHNISSLLERWERRVELVAFLSHNLKESEAQQTIEKVRAIPEVSDARLVSARMSWEELFSDVGDSLDLQETPLDEVLPASIIIKLSPDKRDLAVAKQVASQVASINGVDEVKFEEMLLKRYLRFRSHVASFTVATSIFWVLVFGVITVNIAGLAATARKNEVRTLRTLGASTTFLRRMLTAESVAQGLTGSTVGVASLVAAVALVSMKTGGTIESPLRVFALAFAVGPAVAILAAWFSFRAALAVTAAAAALFIIVSGSVLAQTEPSLDAEVARYQQKLRELELELEQSRAGREKIGMQERALVDELEATDRKLDSLSREIRSGETSVALNKAATARIQTELGRHESAYAQSRQELERWLRLLCNYREPTLIEVILCDIPQSDLTRRREMVSRLAKKETDAFEQARGLRAAVLREQQNLNKRIELDTIYTEAARLRAEQSKEKRKQREALLAGLSEKKTLYVAAISDLEASAHKLQDLIEAQRGVQRPLLAGSAPFREMKGLLPWPVKGEVSAPFGRMKNSDSPTFTRHLGIDITAPAGTEIRAIHDAVVVYSDWFKGYGKLVIMDHGDGYSSVYAHCSEIMVRRGATARAGQAIALIGETGSLKGPFLYFEIRENGTPVDPIDWLQRRSINATQSE